jgi:hypothetical protein
MSANYVEISVGTRTIFGGFGAWAVLDKLGHSPFAFAFSWGPGGHFMIRQKLNACRIYM